MSYEGPNYKLKWFKEKGINNIYTHYVTYSSRKILGHINNASTIKTFFMCKRQVAQALDFMINIRQLS